MKADADTTTAKAAADLVQDGGAGNDKLTGGAGGDQLYGNGGNNQLFGNGNNDKLYGGRADKLYGGSSADYLAGGRGNDLLQGGLGRDVLVGGAGADDFVFKSVAGAGKGAQRDVIRDFSHRQGDEIDLSGIDANGKAAGDQSFAFIGSKAFSGKAGELQYKKGIVTGDVNGDKVADLHIEIANHHALVAGDFILFDNDFTFRLRTRRGAQLHACRGPAFMRKTPSYQRPRPLTRAENLSRILKSGKPLSSHFPAGLQPRKAKPFQRLACDRRARRFLAPFHPEPRAMGQR